MTAFEHPGPAKDHDTLRSFVDTIHALVAAERERDAALTCVVDLEHEVEQLQADLAATTGRLADAHAQITTLLRRDNPESWTHQQAQDATNAIAGTGSHPVDSVPPTGETEGTVAGWVVCPDCGEQIPIGVAPLRLETNEAGGQEAFMDLQMDDIWAHAWTHGTDKDLP